MLEIVFYKPCSRFVISQNKAHMGALVITIGEINPNEEDSSYVYTEWVAADDLSQVKNKKWVASKLEEAFSAISQMLVPDEIVTVEPCKGEF